MTRERAACIVLDRDLVLLMRRYRDGQHYYVIPGGGIEPGETALEACLRELSEETSLHATHASLIVTNRESDGSGTHYFLVEDVTGVPQLGGPEATRNSPTNQYELCWIQRQDVEKMPLRPATAAPAISMADGQANKNR